MKKHKGSLDMGCPMQRTPVIKRSRRSCDFDGIRSHYQHDGLPSNLVKYNSRILNSQMFFGSTEKVKEEFDDSESLISSEAHELDPGFDTCTSLLQVQDIWPRREVTKALAHLPGGQELMALVDEGDVERVKIHPFAADTGIMVASWKQSATILQCLLENKPILGVRDKERRTPLHLAASVGSSECIALLLQFGAEIEAWDSQHIATPLHCAASSGSVDSVRLLLQAGANTEAGSAAGNGKTPIHYAVQSNAVACVQELISHGASVNKTQVYTETPLHVAAGLGFSECVRILLENAADFRVQFGNNKSTPLHLAAEDGNAECARLLLEAGADMNATTTKMQTPLHLAALAQSAKTLELLLTSKCYPNARDVDRRTPLHCAIVKGSRSSECVQLLLQHGADVNAADTFGYTPVHIAALNDFVSSLRLLLDHGGDVTKKTNGNVSALSFIVRRTPEVLKHLESKLDQAIRLHDHEIGDMDCEVLLDFRILVSDVKLGETGLLLTFIEVGQRRLLRHPLCETFLYLKWLRIRKYFILSLIIHGIYVLLCSIYILNVFLAKETVKELPPGFLFLNIVLVLSNIAILVKELLQIAHIRKGYIYQWENWLQWLIIITVFITLIPPSFVPNFTSAQHHISVFGIFFNWIELMVLMGRFPMFGIYVQMFTTGAVNFSKFLLAYCCLLLAFAFSFRMTFPRYKAFQEITVSVVKTVVMMTGELEFEDVFFPEENGRKIDVFMANENVPYPGTAHIFFLLFTLVVTTVLTNLLVGLSVSDIQGLQRSAGLERLSRQVELVAYMESMLFSRLLNWIPLRVLMICRRSATLLSSTRKRTLIVRPNDPREKRVPQYLVKSIYDCVAGRKTRLKGKLSAKEGNKIEPCRCHYNGIPH